MKIALVNTHYFFGGGPDTYALNIRRVLETAGHTVVPFAFDYAETLESPYRVHFPEPITGRGPCRLAQLSLSPAAKIRAAARMFANPGVNRSWRLMLREERPDLVYSVYLSSSFLPQVLCIAKQEFNLPVLYRLSDFHLFCASYLFFREGVPCRDCERTPWSGVRHRCVHGSALASMLRALQMRHHRLRGWYDAVDRFVCPSRFMFDTLAANGIAPERLVHLPTFSRDLGATPALPSNRLPYALFLGKVTEEKGARFLIHAFNRIPNPTGRIRMVGPVEAAYRDELLRLVDQAHGPLVSIEGPLEGPALDEAVRGCRFLVHPALWYENMPNAVLEAMSAGKAVVATALGSLPELVQDRVNGRLVEPQDTDGLARAIEAMSDADSAAHMGAAARARYEAHHAESNHLARLLEIFDACLIQQRERNTLLPEGSGIVRRAVKRL